MNIVEIAKQLGERQLRIASSMHKNGLTELMNASSAARKISNFRSGLSSVLREIELKPLAFASLSNLKGFTSLVDSIKSSQEWQQRLQNSSVYRMAQRVESERKSITQTAAFRKQIESSMCAIQPFTSLLLEATRHVNGFHRVSFTSYKAIRDGLPAIDAQLTKIEPIVHAATAEYVVTEHARPQRADNLERNSAFELLITDLKKNPWFPAMVFYVGMTFTATVGAFVPGDQQNNYQEMRDTLLSFWVFKEMIGFCKDSLDRFNTPDDEA